MAGVRGGAADDVVLALAAEGVVGALVALDVVLAGLAQDGVAGSRDAALRVVQVRQVVVVVVAVRRLLGAGDRAGAGAAGDVLAIRGSRDAGLGAVRGCDRAVALADQDVLAAVAADRVDAALAGGRVAGLAGADELDVEEEDVAELRARLGVEILALRIDAPVAAGERPLDACVVACDHVAVAGRAVAVVARDQVVAVTQRLARARRIERAVAVRVEDCRCARRAAAGDVVLTEVRRGSVSAPPLPSM